MHKGHLQPAQISRCALYVNHTKQIPLLLPPTSYEIFFRQNQFELAANMTNSLKIVSTILFIEAKKNKKKFTVSHYSHGNVLEREDTAS